MIDLAVQEINHAMNAVRQAISEAESKGNTKRVRRLESVQNKLYSAMTRLLAELSKEV